MITTKDLIKELKDAHPCVGSFSFEPDIFQKAAARLEELEAQNKELSSLLSRHYSFKKVCGHDYPCICLQDDCLSALTKHNKGEME